MSFDSIDFMLFFPIVAIAYYVIPKVGEYNLKSVWLLVASYYFYMSWNPKYAVLILLSTVVTYLCGILLDTHNENRKAIVVVCVLFNLFILFFFKYGQFTINNIAIALSKIGISVCPYNLDFLLPVGISFYTFQALGYTVDVYRGDIKAERNFIQYALFVSFFPQLVAGPIERSKNLLVQLERENKFDFLNVREGLLMMLWGFFMKLVIADRVALFVDTVYGDYYTYRGWYIIVATILFGIQIYCDFNGYTMIARGAAKIMGFDLMENFDAPYLATTVSEFWKKWHISLTSWFRDYLYIPLGGNRKGYWRQCLNILVVFAVSGLWHGAEWSFVLWGLLNGFYQVIGKITLPARRSIVSYFKLNSDSLGHKVLKTIMTFILVDFAWLFFRADTIKDSLLMVKNIINTNNLWILFDRESIYKCGLDKQDFSLLIIAIIVLIICDICKTKRISIMKDVILLQDTWCRWIIYIVSFLSVLVFGVWGSGYENAAFLYFQF